MGAWESWSESIALQNMLWHLVESVQLFHILCGAEYIGNAVISVREPESCAGCLSAALAGIVRGTLCDTLLSNRAPVNGCSLAGSNFSMGRPSASVHSNLVDAIAGTLTFDTEL